MRDTGAENRKSNVRARALAWSISSALMLSFQAHPTFGDTTGVWNTDAGGSWTDPANWLNGAIPAVPGDTAIFGPVLIDPLGAVVSLDGNQMVAGLTFNSTAGSYTLVQGTSGTLFMQASTIGSTSLAINIAAGLDTLNVPIIANADLTINATNNSNSPGGLVIDQSIQTSGNFFFNSSGTSIADLHLNGIAAAVTAQTVVIGNTPGVSRVTIDGGTLTATSTIPGSYSLVAGSADGSAVYLTLNSGVISVDREFWLGDRATGSSFSAFTQAGGTLSIGSFFVIGNFNDRAVFNMKGGVLGVPTMTIGAGYTSGNAVGVVNLSGGTVTSPGEFYVGEIGTGILNISGTADVNVASIQFDGVFNDAQSVGILNLNGGTLTAAGNIYKAGGPPTAKAVFNFHGGVLRISNSTNIFTSGNPLDAVYVYPEGAFIDDDGNSITLLLNQPLIAPTGNGVAAISVTPGTGYLDTPLVQITPAPGDSAGFGATAVADVDANGNLIGITMTNPGVGYTKSPIVTLTGGGGTGATVGSVTLSPNSSGGLTKLGTGTLTITSSGNTYAGATNVNSGLLVVNGMIAGSSSVLVKGGAELLGSGTIVGPVTLAGGATPDAQGIIPSDSAAKTFHLSGGLTVGGMTAGTPSALTFDVGFTNSSHDMLVLGSSAFIVNPGGALVKLNNMGALNSGTYTLMSYSNSVAPSNLTLDTSSLVLSSATLSASTTALTLVIAANPFPATAYWSGAYGNSWNAAGGPQSDQANFNTAATGGTNTLQVPGPTTDVIFANTASAFTTLGQNFIIKSLTVAAGAGPVTINGSNALQIAGGSITLSAGSSGLTINSPMILSGPQSWTNNATAPLAINGTLLTASSQKITAQGNVQLGSNWTNFTGTLTIASGTFQIGSGGAAGSLGAGPINNNGALAFDRSDTLTAPNLISGSGSLSAMSGTAILTGTNTFSGGVSIAPGAAVQIGNGGAVGSIGTAGVANNGALVINRTGSLTIAGPVSGAGTVTNSNSGTVTFAGAYSATGPVNIASGEVVFGMTSAPRQDTGVMVKMQSLTMGSNTVLDMTNHDLIIGNTSYAAVQNQILAAFGAVTGPAITTSTSNVLGTGTDNTLPIPIDPAAFGLTSWDNVNITEPNSIIVKYTLFGDSTLDGTVNGDDFSVIAGNFGKTSPGISNILASWLMGDVTLDGFVNGDDFSVVAGNFGKGPLGTLDTPDAPAVVSGGGGSSNVPEPTSLALLGLGMLALRRARKKHS